MDRRRFLGGLAAIGAVTACSSDDGETDRTGAPDGSTTTPVAAAQPADASLPAGVFGLGVASGDPLADRVMLWTRLAPTPEVAGGGSPDIDVEVAYDVATDERFERLVASGVTVARPQLASSVHVDITGLRPDTWYWYRFRTGGQTSPVGRTRTFPAPDSTAERFRFVFASCQDFQWGHYGAWARAAEQPDLDAVVFLGDYIYEISLGDISPNRDGSRVWASPVPMTLEDYRWRYAQTKADKSLQSAHHAVPWIVTFDDHEIANNYAGDVGQADGGEPAGRDRRLAGYQAWYEHTPIRIEPEPSSFDGLRVHRASSFGSLARMFVIETRQHADPPPCRTGADLLTDDGPLCEEAEDPGRTNLGAEQEEWLLGELGDSSAVWNVLANPVMFAGLNIGTAEEPRYTRDMWDGYPAVRARLLKAIVEAEVSNPVVVTGDWHATYVLDVKEAPEGPTVMPEFLVTSITSVNFGTDYRANNPHVRYFAVNHGFALVTVTPEEFRCEFHAVEDVWDPDSPISQVDTWRVKAGSHEAESVT